MVAADWYEFSFESDDADMFWKRELESVSPVANFVGGAAAFDVTGSH